jgi:hypothetical protein
MEFYKLLARDLRHYGMTYKEGLNVDVLPFNPHGECQQGGLYFTTAAFVGEWMNPDWPLIADVTIPADAQVYPEKCGTKWKADRLVLSNIRPLHVFFQSHFVPSCNLAVQGNIIYPRTCLRADRIVLNQDNEDDCLAVVRFWGSNLGYIERQTPAVCEAAVRQSRYAIQYAKEPIPELCYLAVRAHPTAIRYVKNPSDDLCILALDADPGCANVIEPTPALRLRYPPLWV